MRACLRTATLLAIGLLAPALASAQHEHHQPATRDVSQQRDEHAHHAAEDQGADEHAQHRRSQADASGSDGPYLPPITDADRAAAFPDLHGMTAQEHMDDTRPFWFLLFDQLEVGDADHGSAQTWDVHGWYGSDYDKLWLRAEGEREGGRTEHAELNLLYGRAFAPWWEFVAGVRQDFRPGPSRTWAAVGVQGLAPYFFEIEATAFLGESGRTAFRLEAEYEVLLTTQWILQPLVEVNAYGQSDPARGIGSGLSSAEAGLRLRYEIRPEFAPYIGLTREWNFGQTRRFAEAEGEHGGDWRFVAGLRFWF